MSDVVGSSDHLARGRRAFAASAWTDAFDELSAADRAASLNPDDLLSLAMSAYLIGRDADSLQILARSHRESLSAGDTRLAARCAFWLFFQLVNKGDHAQAGGWLARGERALEKDEDDCVERGYLMIPGALQSLFGGDPADAYSSFSRAADFGRRFNDSDLAALGGFGSGQALIAMGKGLEGMKLLDEVMVGITSGEVSAILTGLVYCGVIAACQDVFDLRRAREWTTALTEWCAAQPDLVPYRGQCLVHRSEILQLQGAWLDAMQEAERAREQLGGAPDHGAIGMAFYQLGELHRLGGDFPRADEAYRQAANANHTPHPGLARLRLAQGEVDSAKAALGRELEEARSVAARSKLLPAHVDVALAAGEISAARASAEELAQVAADLDAQLLRALASYAEGAVLLAEGDVRAALERLRNASLLWRELDAPYEVARSRVLIGLACRQLGDEDTAQMEFDAARRTFEGLGARHDLAGVNELSPRSPRPAAGLTGREIEVLALLATGKTNREIAADLVLSDKTVARHVSNIFGKLSVSSRAAATAYAYQHDLV